MKPKANPRIALCPGSFDPVTRGHLDVISRASQLFDRVVVAVIDNPAKSALFDVDERLDMLRRELKGMDSVEVIRFSGLTVEAAREQSARWIVRGIRSAADAMYELPMAHSNRVCGTAPIETIFIAASADVSFVSSSLVREIAARGGRLGAFVTPTVEKALRAKLA